MDIGTRTTSEIDKDLGLKPLPWDNLDNVEVDFALHKVVVVVPAYNEERFIGSVVLKLKRYPVEVLVVDDGSSDGTGEIAKAGGATVISQSENQGKGIALNAGFAAARSLNPDAIVVIDGDGQHLPEELMRIVRPILDGQADIAIGSRYLRNTSNTPLRRRWGHKLINLASNFTSGVNVSDSQSGYRAFSRKAYENLNFQSSGFSVESEMQFLAKEHDLRVMDVPITIRYTDKAKRSAVQQGLTVLNGILRLAGQYRPLLFFGVPGFLLLTTGIIWGLVVIERYNASHTLAAGYAMICLLLSILGLIMLSTGFTLHSIRGLLNDFFGLKQRKQ